MEILAISKNSGAVTIALLLASFPPRSSSWDGISLSLDPKREYFHSSSRS
ncbi:hypothetical protein KC19_6G003500 [Ceratodon purpureus]|uniref:Uncharacterized protein n=1 Tax=Ceratodon purpureus TaxID=3225 RepID=A0A8T0HDJ9_CERPU|nr:hypothetical protein KC19_6G003500 [Ceratodon purpureus]